MKRLLKIHDVAEHYGIPVETLRYWRKVGLGPTGFLVGKRLVYDEDDVDAWVDALREQGRPIPTADRAS